MSGDTYAVIHTPSKFNGCPLHHWPNVVLDVALHWMCYGAQQVVLLQRVASEALLLLP